MTSVIKEHCTSYVLSPPKRSLLYLFLGGFLLESESALLRMCVYESLEYYKGSLVDFFSE